jgi:hypothetical protein
MRTIIAGSRDYTDYSGLQEALEQCGWAPTVVICGGARGADALGKIWAIGQSIPYELYPADWKRYDKSAGYKRNVRMAENAEALIALWDGVSPGTSHMIDIATQKGLKVYVYYYNDLTNKKRSLSAP